MASAVRRDRQPLVLAVRSRTVAKVLSIGFRGPDVLPVLGREVVEGQQRLPILDSGRPTALSYLAPYFATKWSKRLLGRLAALGLIDRVQVLLGLALHDVRQLVQHVGGLVDPAALLPGLGQTSRSAFQKPSAPSPVASSGPTTSPFGRAAGPAARASSARSRDSRRRSPQLLAPARRRRSATRMHWRSCSSRA